MFFLKASKRICSLSDPGRGFEVCKEEELRDEAEKER